MKSLALKLAIHWHQFWNFIRRKFLWHFYIAVSLVTHISFLSWSSSAKLTITNINCQHNPYLKSIKMSIIGGHNSQIWSIITQAYIVVQESMLSLS